MPSGGFLDITFEVSGQEPIQRKLATFGARIDDMSAAWEEVGTELLKDFQQNFQYEGDLFDKANDGWADLAWSTVLDRQRLRFPGEHPILVRKGDLMRSVTQRGAAGNVFEVGRNSLVLGTTDRRAGWLHFGTRDGRIPPRPIVGITPQRRGYVGREGSIVGMLNAYVKRLIQEQGLQP